ncbi:MAG: histidine phosphatase family protein [Nitrospirota bacterium]|nr:histidine phosphatase family protein [Nitrospirota bacterium]
MLPSTLFLIRHGQSEGAGTLSGHSDPPLSAAGHLQAVDASRALERVPLVAVYSSDLARARDTARAVAAPHTLSEQLESDLRERHFGAWEGMRAAELHAADPDAVTRLWSDPEFAPPQGEAFAAVVRRVNRARHAITRRHAGFPVVLVTHAGVLRAVLADLLGLSVAASMQLELATGHAVVMQTFADGGAHVAGINLPPVAWESVWHGLEAEDFRITA